MIGKFVTVPAFRAVPAAMFLATVLAGATSVCAQQTDPSQTPQPQTSQDQSQQPQAPATQNRPAQTPKSQAQKSEDQASSQEASAEDTTRQRRIKVHDYKNWTFNVGGGGSLVNG